MSSRAYGIGIKLENTKGKKYLLCIMYIFHHKKKKKAVSVVNDRGFLGSDWLSSPGGVPEGGSGI